MQMWRWANVDRPTCLAVTLVPWALGSVTLTINPLLLMRTDRTLLALCHGILPVQNLHHVRLTPIGKPDHVRRQTWGQGFTYRSQLQRLPHHLQGRIGLLVRRNI